MGTHDRAASTAGVHYFEMLIEQPSALMLVGVARPKLRNEFDSRTAGADAGTAGAAAAAAPVQPPDAGGPVPPGGRNVTDSDPTCEEIQAKIKQLMDLVEAKTKEAQEARAEIVKQDHFLNSLIDKEKQMDEAKRKKLEDAAKKLVDLENILGTKFDNEIAKVITVV